MVFKHSGKKCIDKAHGFEVQALSVTQIYLLSGKKKKNTVCTVITSVKTSAMPPKGRWLLCFGGLSLAAQNNLLRFDVTMTCYVLLSVCSLTVSHPRYWFIYSTTSQTNPCFTLHGFFLEIHYTFRARQFCSRSSLTFRKSLNTDIF